MYPLYPVMLVAELGLALWLLIKGAGPVLSVRAETP
jgi:hypothetical protein